MLSARRGFIRPAGRPPHMLFLSCCSLFRSDRRMLSARRGFIRPSGRPAGRAHMLFQCVGFCLNRTDHVLLTIRQAGSRTTHDASRLTAQRATESLVEPTCSRRTDALPRPTRVSATSYRSSSSPSTARNRSFVRSFVRSFMQSRPVAG